MMHLLATLLLPTFALLPPLGEGGAPTEKEQTKNEPAAVGEAVPDIQFKTLLRGDGRDHLSQFIGQPVLIAYYSTVFAGMEAAKGTVKIEQDFAKEGVVVILMELKRHDATYIEALAIQGLPGSTTRLARTQDLPIAFDQERGLPPHVALIGVDGTLLYAGTYQQLSKVKKLLKSDLKLQRKGWGESSLVKKSRSLAYGKGKLGQAHSLVQEALVEHASDAELIAVEAELSARYASAIAAVDYLIEQGRAQEALARAKQLGDATRGHPEWEVEVTELLARFEQAEILAELQWGKKLNAILKPLRSKAPAEGLAAKVRKLAEEADGTHVATRAIALAKVIDYSIAKDLSAGR